MAYTRTGGRRAPRSAAHRRRRRPPGNHEPESERRHEGAKNINFENIPLLLQKHASPHEIGTKHLTSDQHVAQCLDLLCFVGDPRRGECIATKRMCRPRRFDEFRRRGMKKDPRQPVEQIEPLVAIPGASVPASIAVLSRPIACPAERPATARAKQACAAAGSSLRPASIVQSCSHRARS